MQPRMKLRATPTKPQVSEGTGGVDVAAEQAASEGVGAEQPPAARMSCAGYSAEGLSSTAWSAS